MGKMKMRSKHNKKRNTAFLYEALVRELTKATLEDDLERKDFIVSVLKEYFKKGTILSKELELYKTLSETNGIEKGLASRLIEESKKQQGLLNKKKLFTEQSNLISKINKSLSGSPFSNFVPNYKNLATVYQVFNGNLSPKKRVLLEEKLLEDMVSQSEDRKEQQPISGLAFKMFAKKFNDVYSNGLLEEQRNLLGRYINSFADNGIELKMYLNEEYGRLSEEVKRSLDIKEIKEDTLMTEKANQVLSIIETFKERPIDNEMLEQTLRIQQLVREIKTNEHQD